MDRRRMATGMLDLDVALGGWTSLGEIGFQMEWGMVRPSTVLLAAEQGAGASTLMQQIAAYVAAHNGTSRGVLYITGDESVDVLAARGARLHADHQLVWARHINTMRGVEESIAHFGPVMTIIDTIQAMRLPEHENAPPDDTVEHHHGVVRIASGLARSHNTCVWLIHRTAKADAFGGLIDDVDVALSMRVEAQAEIGRKLRIGVEKNRFAAPHPAR